MIVLDRETREEIQSIIKATVAEVEIESIKAVGALRTELASIPHLIAQEITSCRREQESRRRWGFGTWLSIFAVGVSVAAFVQRFFSAFTS